MNHLPRGVEKQLAGQSLVEARQGYEETLKRDGENAAGNLGSVEEIEHAAARNVNAGLAALFKTLGPPPER